MKNWTYHNPWLNSAFLLLSDPHLSLLIDCPPLPAADISTSALLFKRQPPYCTSLALLYLLFGSCFGGPEISFFPLYLQAEASVEDSTLLMQTLMEAIQISEAPPTNQAPAAACGLNSIPQSSQPPAASEMADNQVSAAAAKPKTAFKAQNATTKDPNAAYDFSQAVNAKETLPKAAFMTQKATPKGPNAAYDFSQAATTSELTANNSEMAFKAQNATTKVGPNATYNFSQSLNASEMANTQPKTAFKAWNDTTKATTADTQTQNVNQAKMATSQADIEADPGTSESDGAAAQTSADGSQAQNLESRTIIRGKRTRKVRSLLAALCFGLSLL